MEKQSLDVVRGTLDVIILRTLSWGPLHGYAIAQWIRQQTDEAILVEEGALYPALYRMEDKGWIDAEWGLSENNRRAKYYRLTPAGHERLASENPHLGKLRRCDCQDSERHPWRAGGESVKRDEPMWRRYLRFFGPNPAEDVDDELRFHLEEKTSLLMQQGMQRAEARAEAIRQFGDLNEFRRICRQQRTQRESRMDRRDYFAGWIQDLRYAARRLKSDLGFTSVAVLILALGIAASTTVFTIVHALIIRPLPFHEPERLVWIANAGKGRDASDPSSITSRIGTLMSWRETTTSFEKMAGYNAFFGYFSYNFYRPGGTPERLNGVGVTDSFFETLGVQPVLGRLFTPEEVLFGFYRVSLLT
ncbi:MAG: PadR family transcriptional regulator, partial [Paludibaculum sp.]